MNMDAARYSETLVPIYQNKWHHVLEESNPKLTGTV